MTLITTALYLSYQFGPKSLKDHIYKHLSEHILLYEYQSGFRPQHSCEAALLQMIDTWLKDIDNNRLVGTIFLDLQKAFDVVDHSILVKRTGCIWTKWELCGMVFLLSQQP